MVEVCHATILEANMRYLSGWLLKRLPTNSRAWGEGANQKSGPCKRMGSNG